MKSILIAALVAINTACGPATDSRYPVEISRRFVDGTITVDTIHSMSALGRYSATGRWYVKDDDRTVVSGAVTEAWTITPLSPLN